MGAERQRRTLAVRAGVHDQALRPGHPTRGLGTWTFLETRAQQPPSTPKRIAVLLLFLMQHLVEIQMSISNLASLHNFLPLTFPRGQRRQHSPLVGTPSPWRERSTRLSSRKPRGTLTECSWVGPWHLWSHLPPFGKEGAGSVTSAALCPLLAQKPHRISFPPSKLVRMMNLLTS